MIATLNKDEDILIGVDEMCKIAQCHPNTIYRKAQTDPDFPKVDFTVQIKVWRRAFLRYLKHPAA